MTTDSTLTDDDTNLFLGAAWFDPIEAGIRDQIRGFIEGMVEEELATALGRGRYQRGSAVSADAEESPSEVPDAPAAATGHRHGHRRRQLLGSFGAVELAVPRARLRAENGGTREWRSAVLPRYRRQTRQVEALIAGAYLAGTNTRRVKRALAAVQRQSA
jgi:putative transposase